MYIFFDKCILKIVNTTYLSYKLDLDEKIFYSNILYFYEKINRKMVL